MGAGREKKQEAQSVFKMGKRKNVKTWSQAGLDNLEKDCRTGRAQREDTI